MCRTTSAQPLRVDESVGADCSRTPSTARYRATVTPLDCVLRQHGPKGIDTRGIRPGLRTDQRVRQHRAIKFEKSLAKIDTAVPDDLDARMVWTTTGQQVPRHQRLAGNTTALPHAFHPEQFQLDQPGRTLVRLRHRPAGPLRQPVLGPRPRKVVSRGAVSRVNVRPFRLAEVLPEVAGEPGKAALALDRLILGRCCG
jgi:hypothetical protein